MSVMGSLPRSDEPLVEAGLDSLGETNRVDPPPPSPTTHTPQKWVSEIPCGPPLSTGTPFHRHPYPRAPVHAVQTPLPQGGCLAF